MPAASKRKKCPKCGTRFDPLVSPCPQCVATNTVGSDSARRVATAVRERLAGDNGGTGPVCPYCRAEITWDTVATIETEITIYVREKIFFCPACRAFLGVSSWHSEG